MIRLILNNIYVSKAKETEVRGTRLVITGLKTGGQYRFRVTAFNAAGNGEPGEVPEVLEVNDRTSELRSTVAPKTDTVLYTETM